MEGRRPQSGRARRAAIGVVTAALVVIASGAFVGIGLAESQRNAAAAQYQYDKKVTICHKAGPHGKRVTITVSRNALPAHRAHGDTMGPCPAGASKAAKKDRGATKATAKSESKAKAKGVAKAETKSKSKAKSETKARNENAAKGETKAKEKSAGAGKAPAPAAPQPAPEKGAEGKGHEDKGSQGRGHEDKGGNDKGNGKGKG